MGSQGTQRLGKVGLTVQRAVGRDHAALETGDQGGLPDSVRSADHRYAFLDLHAEPYGLGADVVHDPGFTTPCSVIETHQMNLAEVVAVDVEPPQNCGRRARQGDQPALLLDHCARQEQVAGAVVEAREIGGTCVRAVSKAYECASPEGGPQGAVGLAPGKGLAPGEEARARRDQQVGCRHD